ncbi:MAG: DUF5662 family protein, partial [Mycoplasmatales bacterium]
QTYVREDLNKVILDLINRSQTHDEDKIFNDIQNEAYEKHFATLKSIPYATKEYYKYEQENFYEAHQSHAQNDHHFYSHRNTHTEPDIIDLLEAIIDINASNKQYSSGSIDHTMNTLKKKGILDISLEEFILNTLKNLKNL